MTPTPRKVRSGRRQFGPSPGTEQEWAKVMQSPHVQRAFQDPAIQQALMQHMQQQAASAAPAAPPPPAPGMAHGGPTHFDTGGASSAEVNDIQQQLADPAVPETRKTNLRMRLTQIQAQQSQAGALPIPGGGTVSGGTMNGLNQMVKPPTMGNTALAAGVGALMGAGATSHQGMSALLGAGLSGALSYLVRKYGKGAQAQQKAQSGGAGGPTADTVDSSGATSVPSAQAWNPGWRDQSTAAPSPPAAPASGPTGGPESVSGLPNVGALPSGVPNAAVPASPGQSGRLMMGTANSDSGNVISWDGGKTWKDSKTGKPYADPVANQSQIDPRSSLTSATSATTPPPQDSPATADSTQSGPSVNALGPAFAADQQKRLDKGLIRRGPAAAQAPGWNEKLAQNAGGFDASDLADLPMQSNAAMDPFYGTGGLGLAEGGPVPDAPPSGLGTALPVLHTTIVIAGKPKKSDKPEKKQAGGAFPLKPQLLPPKHGPGDHDHGPRPHGRVQVPRGSGAAIKGKRFGGIY